MLLTLQDWKESAEELTHAEAAGRIGVCTEHFHEGSTVLLYDGELYVEMLADGRFWTIVERSEVLGTREKCETFLYFEWYCTECHMPSGYTLDNLPTLLAEWSAFKGIPCRSADEMLAEPATFEGAAELEADRRRRWLEWFIDTWNKAEARWIASKNGGRA